MIFKEFGSLQRKGELGVEGKDVDYALLMDFALLLFKKRGKK